MGDENGFEVGMGIAFENGYGYEYEFLKSITDCVPDLIVIGNKNTLKPKNEC